ncbi:MAG: alpha/beta hydrolase [Cyanobacteria bacterium CRU_2_1]|nr:alpha/beta hydrolase [Cyanobacteria bacterium RU_5_0]NJR57881.1 alpha/beta hydrolase [Cyanobacteria bacterium CRU_2_1]
MNTNVEIIAYHGWGFDRTCWYPWKTLLLNKGFRFQLFDRGYFGNESNLTFNLPWQQRLEELEIPSKRVILIHSYGLHLCPIEHLQLSDLLIIFSSFREFHPELEPFRRRSKVVLDQMKQQLNKTPEIVLNTFKAKCYHPQLWQPIAHSACNLDLLVQDLEHLGTSSVNIELLQSLPKVIIFHGVDDRIVSIEKGQELFETLEANSDYFEIKGAGHALPFTHLKACWSFIDPFICE